MVLETKRLILRPWTEGDSESLFEYAKSGEVGPIAGWFPHKDITESREIIRTVLSGETCFAVCLKEDNRAVGCVGLKLRGDTDYTDREDECELGYWIGRPFWGQGLIPEAAECLLRFAFEEMGMRAVWCSCYEGNSKSARVQDKLGFLFHHREAEAFVPSLGESRGAVVSCITKRQFTERYR